MLRRQFLALIGSAGAMPAAVRAQNSFRRIAVQLATAENDPGATERLDAFISTLGSLGWVEGQNLEITVRWSRSDPRLHQEYAVELINRAPEVVVVATSAVLKAVTQKTSGIPIVFMYVTDPAGQGFVQSLARPGGNVTGFTHFEYSFSAKWLQLLKEAAPDVKRVAVIYNPGTMATVAKPWLQPVLAEAPALGVAAIQAEMKSSEELESALISMAQSPGSGLLVLPDTFTTANRDKIVEIAARLRIPAIYPFSFFVTRGGLMSYGADLGDIFIRAAHYVDRILKGEKPADLPVQAPTKFEFAINLKTAKVLGLNLPSTLLARADELIE
jgi:putative tryptophan/tyrosine transport system substrate-binding protein